MLLIHHIIAIFVIYFKIVIEVVYFFRLYKRVLFKKLYLLSQTERVTDIYGILLGVYYSL